MQTPGVGAGGVEKGAWGDFPRRVGALLGADHRRHRHSGDPDAGLGAVTEPLAVGHAVTAVYLFCWIPFGLAAVFYVSSHALALPRGSTRLALAD